MITSWNLPQAYFYCFLPGGIFFCKFILAIRMVAFNRFWQEMTQPVGAYLLQISIITEI